MDFGAVLLARRVGRVSGALAGRGSLLGVVTPSGVDDAVRRFNGLELQRVHAALKTFICLQL